MKKDEKREVLEAFEKFYLAARDVLTAAQLGEIFEATAEDAIEETLDEHAGRLGKLA